MEIIENRLGQAHLLERVQDELRRRPVSPKTAAIMAAVDRINEPARAAQAMVEQVTGPARTAHALAENATAPVDRIEDASAGSLERLDAALARKCAR